MVACLPGAKIGAIIERVENIVGSGKGGSVLVHLGTNNVEREGTTAIVRKYRQLVGTLKQTRVELVVQSGILPVMGRTFLLEVKGGYLQVSQAEQEATSTD